MKLLLLNAFKGLRKKKVQMIGIILLVMLSTAIFTSMSLSLDRFEDRYYSYIDEQNIEDLSITPTLDYKTAYTYYDILNLMKKYPFTEEENMLVMGFANCLREEIESCPKEITENIGYVFDKYQVGSDKKGEILDDLAFKYNFKYEKTYSKQGQDDNIVYKVMPYNKNKKINKPYLLEGKFPSEDNEITILRGFANKNNLKIGDKYKLGDTKYKIVGFSYASDYMYPLISISSPLFTESKNNIVFMNQTSYNNFKGVEEVVNSIKYNYKFDDREDLLDQIKIFDKEDKVSVSVFDLLRMSRTKTPKLEFNNDRLFAQYFLYLLLGISVIIILIITKKRIDDERGQIGVLKALGYKTKSIATSYLTYPIIGGLVGGIIGYFIGLAIHPFITELFVSYFNLPISDFSFDFKYLLLCTLVPTIILSILTYLISLIMLRHKALHLLREGSNLKVNIFNKFILKVTKNLKFKSRFRYSLASRSLGKLFIVTLTSFTTGLLIVLTLIGLNLFSSLIDKNFNGLNFNYMVSFSTPQIILNNKADLILDKELKLDKVYDKNGKEKEIIKKNKNEKDGVTITINGMDKDTKYFYIKDKNNKAVLKNIKHENDIIINSNIESLNGINIGDKIKFENSDIKFNVVGIHDNFFSKYAYMSRSTLSKMFNMELSYNKIFTKDNKYSSYSKIDNNELSNIASIFSLKDLKENMDLTMQTSNYSLYVIIAFAGVMSLIIIAVIANIVVEENKKTISLMKVMGYNNKSISSIVLNIYTPFVIIAYLLSIPAMIGILKAIVSVLTKDIDYMIPISLSWSKALIGLTVLLIGYYTAIFLSKKTLNKVPLAVALKRE